MLAEVFFILSAMKKFDCSIRSTEVYCCLNSLNEEGIKSCKPEKGEADDRTAVMQAVPILGITYVH